MTVHGICGRCGTKTDISSTSGLCLPCAVEKSAANAAGVGDNQGREDKYWARRAEEERQGP